MQYSWIVVIAALLAGCGPLNMVKSGGTAQEFDLDKSECNDEAVQIASSMGLTSEVGFAIQKRMSTKECLTKRGYVLKGSKEGMVIDASLKNKQPTENEPGVIKVFSGTGATTTRPFTVPDKWEIQWNARGAAFAIYLKDGQGKLLGVPASQQGPGSGSAYQPKGGEFILQINPIGSWTVKVVKVD